MTRAAAFLCLMLASAPSLAADRYAVVITGAAGGEEYARKYDEWRERFVSILRETLGFDAAHLTVLAETDGPGVGPATRPQVQTVFGELRRRVTKDDLVFVLLIGHGTSLDNDEAKFNLVGPDLSGGEWADLVKPIPGRVVFVDTTAASFPFLAKLSGRGRVVLTATDTATQQFETVFPEHFIQAFDDPAADSDKNGRTSIWEAFSYASAQVRRWFEQEGQLPTERPLLDDDGDGIGREAQNPGVDGTLARQVYLDADAPATADAALAALLRRRADLEAQIEALKARKGEMSSEAYDAELERLATELARVSAQIRVKPS